LRHKQTRTLRKVKMKIPTNTTLKNLVFPETEQTNFNQLENHSDSSEEQELSNPSAKPSSLLQGVKESKNALLKERLRTIIRSKGLTEREFYHSLNMSRQYWYGVSWGLLITPYDLKLKIAAALDVDSTLIWINKQDGDSDGSKM